MPSPCAALTSRPSLISFLTVALSLFWAASAIGARDCAPMAPVIATATINVRSFFICDTGSNQRRLKPSLSERWLYRGRRVGRRFQIHHRVAVAERIELEADAAQRPQHGVGHRR